MKVYVLLSYHCDIFLGVYSTHEKAVEQKLRRVGYDLYIEEWELDKEPK